jgi:hypothetical protein
VHSSADTGQSLCARVTDTADCTEEHGPPFLHLKKVGDIDG